MVEKITEKLEIVSLKQFSAQQIILLLQYLGYQTDGKFVLGENGEVIIDKYVEVPVRVDNMVIFPGSTLILDDNELSVAKYIEEYGDVF